MTSSPSSHHASGSGARPAALCDVDNQRAAAAYTKFPAVPKYQDFRVMLDKQKDGTMVSIHGGGTCRRRMHSARDYSGAEIMRTLRDEVKNHPDDIKTIVEADGGLCCNHREYAEFFLREGIGFAETVDIEESENPVLVNEWGTHRGADPGDPQALAGGEALVARDIVNQERNPLVHDAVDQRV